LDTSFLWVTANVGCGGCGGGTWGRKQRQNRCQQKASRLYEGPVHQSLYYHGAWKGGGMVFFFLFVMEMEIGIRRKATMTEMVNDDEETSSSVIIYLFILEFIRFSEATSIPRWSGQLYDIYDMDDIEIVFTQ
jgi:hypothetical protein